MENIKNPKKRKLDDESIALSIKKQNSNLSKEDFAKQKDTQNVDLSNDNENNEQFDIEILEVPIEENNSEECINEINNEQQMLNEEDCNIEDYDIEDYLIEPDVSDDINEYKYGDFMKHIEESDYTANYGENEDGDYDF